MEPISVNKQSSIRISGSKTLYFDPLEREEKHDADYIFITHPHFDHFSLLSILELKKEDTVFVTPKDIVEELLSIGISEEYIVVVKPNRTYSYKNIEFRTIPAYNLHKKNHKKDAEWVGYIVELDKVIYYIAGDTDVTKEAKEVNCDVAFLPVGGTYTMDCIEAATLCNIIKPKLAIPIHYGYVVGSIKDAEVFKKRLTKDIACKILMK
ncbi:TPA: MBL fold metallo-hydrolase [Candidatus Ventrenecus stercoripullorum]|nr:MBL fold metallo-hydrolase [Candidatus Ventrenecus stercoripullorum]